MKKALLLISIVFLTMPTQAQISDYNKQWTLVETYEKEGLPKSALSIVDAIYRKAKKEQNNQELIKSMLFKGKYAIILEEHAQLKIIDHFNSEIAESTLPTKNILQSLLANMYWQYFKSNRYKIYNRTKTQEKVNVEDFRTWDLETLFNEIKRAYKNSLSQSKRLQQIPLEQFNSQLETEKDSKIYRPTLYDFLSHEALSFFKTTENSITKPANKFVLDNPALLSKAKTFVELNLVNTDSTSLQFDALKLFQNLIQFHLNDSDPSALTDINIERLQFVSQHGNLNNKTELIIKTFEADKRVISTHEASGLYDFQIAKIYYQQSKQYQPNTNETHRWKAKEAVAYCASVVKKFPKSHASKLCKNLKNTIEDNSYQIKTESHLPIQQHARLLVKYKNVDFLKFDILKLSRNDLETFRNIHRKDEQLAFIKKLRSIEKWNSPLKNEHDYQNHSTEILIPKLNNGNYLIYASQNDDDSTFAFCTIQVTNLALIETNDTNYKTLQVIDRNNGAPISNAKLEIKYLKHPNKKDISETYLTNNLGQIHLEKTDENYKNFSVKLSHGNDLAYFGNYYLGRKHETETEKTQYKGFIFTDKSIYRPRQIVYFKAIAIKTDQIKSIVQPNLKVLASLYNVNNELIKKLELTTNEYGSVSGEFILPNNGLNGQYHIVFDGEKEDLYTEQYFSVEEYKRPKFKAKFNPVTKTYKVEDSIRVSGFAKSYSGSPITHAKVVYHVQRKVQFPDWYYWHRPYFYSESQEITHGETNTNSKGEFIINFKAIPDQNADKKDLPVFHYELTAYVTDINGETRSTTTFVNVGYHALTANMEVNQELDKNKKDHVIKIDIKNLNNEIVNTTGSIKIYKLNAPDFVLRPRPWSAPDYQLFDKDEFKTLFPHEAFHNEDNPNNWSQGNLIFNKTFDTKKSKQLALGNIKRWESGDYVIILESKDKFNQIITDKVRTTLYSSSDKIIADHQLFQISADKSAYNIGDTVELSVGSASENCYVTINVEKNNKLVSSEIIQLNNNKKTIQIPVNQNDLGGFALHYSYAAYNSYHSGTKTIKVPYPKTELQIETNTFRDNLEPGTSETWSFTLKGPKGEKVSAEILASMYDASLDHFRPYNWSFNPLTKSIYHSKHYSNSGRSFGIRNFRVYQKHPDLSYYNQLYDQFNWFGFNFSSHPIMIRGIASKSNMLTGAAPASEDQNITVMDSEEVNGLEEEITVGYAIKKTEVNNTKELNFEDISIRTNLQETAFFFPHLSTNDKGQVNFSFTSPEALTQWKLQLLAHTKNLESSVKAMKIITQKKLMVTPNTPRFLRVGDNITISSKISNLTKNNLTGQASLILTDAITGHNINKALMLINTTKTFHVNANGNTQVSWQLQIPETVNAMEYKIVAKSDAYSDGEQNILPVLSNRMLVTETLPMWVKSGETKNFTLNKLKSNTSKTIKNHQLTLEITSNPAWYAVQALPYLMEYPHSCNEQIFSRYYANALASHIVRSNPKIQAVFNQWASANILISNLEKNSELKSILIQETPWLRDAQSETEQKKRIALLFNLNKMQNELQAALNKLKNNQMYSGAWSWFQGGYENRYITQHIIAGLGHLKHLNVSIDTSNEMIVNAIDYLDNQFVKEYNNIHKFDKTIDLSEDHLTYTQLHYLYMRSFYPEIKKSEEVDKITLYYQNQIRKYWLSHSLYAKGLMALISHRNNDNVTSEKILKSLKETSISSETLGMYWKTNSNSWFWHQAPIETQALLIEAFSEIENDITTVDNLKMWLLQNKQTNRWKTTKATTEAIYALLLQGSDWLSVDDSVEVELAGRPIAISKLDNIKTEAGTGYYQIAWPANEITSGMADITLTKNDKGIAWGGLYWQYFEDLDKITTAKTPLQLNKKLFKKSYSNTGEILSEITPATTLNVGDLIRVRIELKCDRTMEFIHMKDMRASGLEPANVFSTYKWQDGLGYYQSTKDASTNFFFDVLPKGIYVFEYDLRVNNAGDMSNGITTIQSMYAPEFSSHSKGTRIEVLDSSN
ncbi:alpha-2-macroglobulin family protein [Gaetbulibacter saemankumensis]|uniref:alpha-2-macroglobulin family protein n=1 Tax=Gaetbulibacter saemankumensis TaxID=311208 RepID=UPI0005554B2B|nr:alpha-2-macroglobulin family protein [Gaetbulibacter saemankumensis]